MNRQLQEAKNGLGEVVKPKPTLSDLLLNSPLSGSGLDIVRDTDDFADGRLTPLNLWGETDMQ